MDVIDYEIFGSELQYVEIELDPGEAAVGEPGSMMYMDDGIRMETIFGDGSAAQQGMMGKLFGAGKRLLAGESMFTTLFINEGSGKRRLAFAAPLPGRIIPVNLQEIGGSLLCQRDAFLCAARGVSLSMAFQKKLSTGLFGGEGFILEKLDGDGMAFVQAGGTIMERQLAAGELLRVDTGCVVAFQPSVNFEIEYIGSVKSALFSGEGLFYAKLTGPGKIWVQSMPFGRLAKRIASALNLGKRSGEGGITFGDN